MQSSRQKSSRHNIPITQTMRKLTKEQVAQREVNLWLLMFYNLIAALITNYLFQESRIHLNPAAPPTEGATGFRV